MVLAARTRTSTVRQYTLQERKESKPRHWLIVRRSSFLDSQKKKIFVSRSVEIEEGRDANSRPSAADNKKKCAKLGYYSTHSLCAYIVICSTSTIVSWRTRLMLLYSFCIYYNQISQTSIRRPNTETTSATLSLIPVTFDGCVVRR